MIIKSMIIGGVSIDNTPDSMYRIGERGIDGLENPSVRLSTYDLPQDHGAIMTDHFFSGRTLLFDIQIVANTREDYLEARRTLLGALSADNTAETEIKLVDVDLNEYKILGRTRSTTKGEDDFGKQTHGTLSIEFYCATIEIFGFENHTTQILLPNTDGGFAIPFEIPLALGSVVSDGKGAVTNSGNFRAYPTLAIYGKIENPVIKNNTTGDEFGLIVENTNTTDVLTIDTRTGIVRNNGTIDMSLVDITKKDLITLKTGSNELYFSHDGSFEAETYLLVSWNDTYIGL